jgi:hypothetical protein
MAKDGMKKLNPGLRKYLMEKKNKGGTPKPRGKKEERNKIGRPKDRSKKM